MMPAITSMYWVLYVFRPYRGERDLAVRGQGGAIATRHVIDHELRDDSVPLPAAARGHCRGEPCRPVWVGVLGIAAIRSSKTNVGVCATICIFAINAESVVWAIEVWTLAV